MTPTHVVSACYITTKPLPPSTPYSCQTENALFSSANSSHSYFLFAFFCELRDLLHPSLPSVPPPFPPLSLSGVACWWTALEVSAMLTSTYWPSSTRSSLSLLSSLFFSVVFTIFHSLYSLNCTSLTSLSSLFITLFTVFTLFHVVTILHSLYCHHSFRSSSCSLPLFYHL